jgi:hypothetical protein
MVPVGPNTGECREENQEDPPLESGICNPIAKRSRILRQSLWQAVKNTRRSFSCVESDGGRGCCARELTNSAILNALWERQI